MITAYIQESSAKKINQSTECTNIYWIIMVHIEHKYVLIRVNKLKRKPKG
jgi:hypothetical protein